MKIFISCLLLLCIYMGELSVASAQESRLTRYSAAMDSQSQVGELKMALAKLRVSMSSMKDLDELEQIGMPLSEVNIMRHALREKIKEMTSAVLISIQQL